MFSSGFTDIFACPDWYPTFINFELRTVTFVRMTPQTYKDTVFLDRRVKHEGGETHYRLDDLILAGRQISRRNRSHFILNTAYCCSTLLARYFELLPDCLVLKEPGILVQAALMMDGGDERWRVAFELANRLLTRTYGDGQLAVIKPYEPCNRLGGHLLEANEHTTVSFLMTSLRNFILSILKLEERRGWVRSRSFSAVRDARGFTPFGSIDPARLSDAEAAACAWMSNRYVYSVLASNFGDRVLLVNGDHLARSPAPVVEQIFRLCDIDCTGPSLNDLLSQTSIDRYSKDIQRPFDSESRDQQLEALERCWREEADAGVAWAYQNGLSELRLPNEGFF